MLPRLGGSVLTWIRGNRYWPQGHCLAYTRTAFGLGSKYPSAISAWNHAEHKHHGDPTPPPSVPVYFSGGQYGHIGTSAGGGFFWSTDAVIYGHVDKVSIAGLAAKWGYTYLGWTEDLNDQRVYAPPTVDLSRVKAAAKLGGTVSGGKRIKVALAAEVGRGWMTLSDARLGRRFKRRYRAWQRRLGYVPAACDGIPGKASLTELGRRHGFSVHD